MHHVVDRYTMMLYPQPYIAKQLHGLRVSAGIQRGEQRREPAVVRQAGAYTRSLVSSA